MGEYAIAYCIPLSVVTAMLEKLPHIKTVRQPLIEEMATHSICHHLVSAVKTAISDKYPDMSTITKAEGQKEADRIALEILTEWIDEYPSILTITKPIPGPMVSECVESDDNTAPAARHAVSETCIQLNDGQDTSLEPPRTPIGPSITVPSSRKRPREKPVKEESTAIAREEDCTQSNNHGALARPQKRVRTRHVR
jgi:hypothetical protein